MLVRDARRAPYGLVNLTLTRAREIERERERERSKAAQSTDGKKRRRRREYVGSVEAQKGGRGRAICCQQPCRVRPVS